VSRVNVVTMGMGMKRGKYLCENKCSRNLKVPEFKLEMVPGNTIDLNVREPLRDVLIVRRE
jgi:hypothetical protein